MSCQSFVLDGGTVVSINRPGATHEIHRESLGHRWCFQCRSRQEFFYVITAEIEPSYYGPNPSVQCGSRAHEDGDCFPGTSREWEG